MNTNQTDYVEETVAANTTVDAALYAKVYTHASDQTEKQMSKIGDICVLDTGAIYIAKSTTKSSGWVELDITP